MKTHIQIVAILHIVFGVLALGGALFVFAGFGFISGIALSQGEQEVGGVLGVVAVIFGCFLAVVALPGIIGGWGLLADKGWARVVVLVLAALNLPNIPFGTALGIYTFWALLAKPKDELLYAPPGG